MLGSEEMKRKDFISSQPLFPLPVFFQISSWLALTVLFLIDYTLSGEYDMINDKEQERRRTIEKANQS